jgi:GT2 family glycosyltransferase
LEAVFNQDRLADDILVVDDGSTDESVRLAKKYPVRVIRHPVNLGLASARNTAIKNTKAELIASLDSDCKPSACWLKRLSGRMANSKVAGAGGKTVEADTSSVVDRWRSVHMKQHWGDKVSGEPPFLFGSNTLFRRDLLLEVGSYNEKYRSNFEDVDISRRLRGKGYRLVYEPKAVVRHLKKDDISSLMNAFWKWNFSFYLKQGFYNNSNRFASKIRDNIGLSNRLLEEDIKGRRYGLLYIDFLLALHHSLRDFDYFSSHGKQEEFNIAARSKISAWLSLIDLAFFYHLDREKMSMNTLAPKENAFQQNFFALGLLLAIFTKTKFTDKRFNRILYSHLFYSLHKIGDSTLVGKLLTMVELHPDWSDFVKKKQANIDSRFLDVLSVNFKNWVDILIYRFPGIVRLIEKSARQAENAMV